MSQTNTCRRMYEDFNKLMQSDTAQKAFYTWMLANGKEFKGRTLTLKERKWLQTKVTKRLFTPRNCFLQSQVGACDGELRYFEGQATTKTLGLPLEHAWLVDAEDKVWDATWKDGEDYFGVEIPSSFIRKNILATGVAQDLLGRYFGEVIYCQK